MKKNTENKKRLNWFAFVFSSIVFVVILTIWQIDAIVCMIIWFAIYYIFKWIFDGLTNKESWIGFMSIMFIIVLIFLLFICN